jgi:hypothetical protein
MAVCHLVASPGLLVRRGTDGDHDNRCKKPQERQERPDRQPQTQGINLQVPDNSQKEPKPGDPPEEGCRPLDESAGVSLPEWFRTRPRGVERREDEYQRKDERHNERRDAQDLAWVGNRRQIIPHRIELSLGVGVPDLARDQRALHLLDGFGDFDVTRASVRAIEDGPASPYPGSLVQDLQPLCRALVPTIEDKPVRIHDGSGTDELIVGPGDRASRRACRAKNALGRIVEPVTLSRGLQPLSRCRGVFGDKVGLHGLVGVEKLVHIHQEILLDLEADQGLEGDTLPEVLHEDLAGKTVAAVDAHGIRATNSVRAGTPIGQRAVVIPPYVVERVQNPVGSFHLNRIFLEMGLGVGFRVEPLDSKGDLHGDAFLS